MSTYFLLHGVTGSVELVVAGLCVSNEGLRSRHICAERDRLVNAISLKNAELCADWMSSATARTMSASFAGAAHYFNISRPLGGMLPRKRATLVDTAS
jgi:hypothetical protein